MEDVRSKKEEIQVRVDTVYIEKRDSVLVERHQPSALSQQTSSFITALKWILAIICAIIVLIIVIKMTPTGSNNSA